MVKCRWLMVVLLACSSYSYRLQCPDFSQRPFRALGYCTSSLRSKYTCLYDTNKLLFTEQCNRNPDFVTPGEKYVITGNLRNVDCSAERYQPFRLWSNVSGECMKKKSLCEEEGQVIVNNGSLIGDGTCRCDYTKGYKFTKQPKQNCSCTPSEEDCSCHITKCPGGTVLSPDYECVVGKHHADWKCPPIDIESGSMQTTRIISYTEKQKQLRIILIAVSVLLVMILTYTVIVFVCCDRIREITKKKGYVYSDKCYNKSRDGVARPGFCCNNHEEKNGIYVECEDGYVSKDGVPCNPCLLGRWGRKCRYLCRCQQNESCNNVHGCVQRTTGVPEKFESTFTKQKEATHLMTTSDNVSAVDKNGFVQSDKCSENLSNGTHLSWFCCNNHERKNGECVECEIGYASKDRFPCKPCSPGLWGSKCKEICRCMHNERCDMVFGCIAVTTENSEIWKSTFTEPKETTYVMTTLNIFSATYNNDGILLKRETIVSLISAVSIAVMIGLAICCFMFRKLEHLYKSRSKTVHGDQISIEKEHERKNNRSTYDLIDYDVMNNDSLIRIVTSVPLEHDNQA